MAISLPLGAGVGYKPAHHDALLDVGPDVRFVEIHAENYLGDGGAPHRRLRELIDRFALSVHGVGLSIGGTERPDRHHLARIRGLLERYPVAAFSEHLAWSAHAGRWMPDLLPVTYDNATLARVCAHVAEVQDALGRRILIENPSSYVSLRGNYSEAEFLELLCQRSGCALLLDINNLFISASNREEEATHWLDAIPLARVGEIHVAGHARTTLDDGRTLRVDDHGSAPNEAVWSLLRRFLSDAGERPVLLEWDTDVPEWPQMAACLQRIDAERSRALAERMLAQHRVH